MKAAQPARDAGAGRPRASRRSGAASAPPRLTLSVQSGVTATGLPARSTIRRWMVAALERDAFVTLRYVGAGEGRRLNRQFRGKDYATNVLTFVYDGGVHDAPKDAPLAGDIVICVPVVRREARAAARPMRAHLAHLVVHGVLHLQGYDHERDDDAATMEHRESDLLSRLRYADPHAPAGAPGVRTR